MKVSLIIAAYKQYRDIALIAEALQYQTYKNFEVIIAEDNDSIEMRNLVESFKSLGLDVKHTYQKDEGIYKAKSQNNAILESTGEYLIFIDADCIPYSNFIENHVALSKEGQVLAGRRANLGPKYSQRIKAGEISTKQLESRFFRMLPSLWRDCDEGHIEDGLSLSVKSKIFHKWIYPKNTSIVGCNFSGFKKDFVAINGFDESYGESDLADDTDIEWRLRAYGLSIKSCKFAANMFHLHHSRSFRERVKNEFETLMLERKVKGLFKAHIGLDSH